MFINTKIGYTDIVIQNFSEQSDTFAKISAGYIMESKLIVKNFGPINNVELDLRNVNVFIGPQASGKSALAKLYTIFKAPRKFFYKSDLDKNEILILDDEKASKDFANVLAEYNIKSFLKPETEIILDSELHSFEYINGEVAYYPKLKVEHDYILNLSLDFDANKNDIENRLLAIADKFIVFSINATKVLRIEGEEKDAHFLLHQVIARLDKKNCRSVLNELKSIEEDLSTNTALYIPAERIFSNLIKKYSLNLLLNKVPIPKHILSFGAELEKIELKEIPLRFIQKGLVYKIVDGEDRVFINETHSFLLDEAASGIQSVIPILLPILAKKSLKHRSFVIEEPELNLFPEAQYELIQFLESNRTDSQWEDWGTIHTYTTHSPYILSALNNLLYANKVKDLLTSDNDKSPEEIDKIIKKIVKARIKPDSFSAYQICKGSAESIFSRETGLIKENYIDAISDKIDDDFNDLMDLIK